VVDRCYIDPTFAPSPAAYALFGWALMRHFSADAGTIVRAMMLPDPRLTAPAPGPTLPVSPPPTSGLLGRSRCALALAYHEL